MLKINKLFIFVCFFVSSVSAQYLYYGFGRNKVQYNDFEWHILKTDHFDIYYYPEMKALAERGAYYAEEVYKNLEDRFNHSLDKRVPLIFYSSHLHFQQTNITPGFVPEGVGGFFEFLKGRVVIPSDGSIHRFRHVIRHELVHVFMSSKISRVLKDHRRITSQAAPPLWFTEGLAEAWSGEADVQADMVIRDAVVNNYLVPLEQMYQIYGTFLMYKEGENILHFIESRYGKEKVFLLMENIWRSEEFEKIFQFTLGMTYKEFDEQWTYSMRKKYYPVLKENDLPGMVSIRITQKGFNNKPAFYNDGGTPKVVYVGNYFGYSGIFEQVIKPYDDKDRVPEPLVKGEQSAEFEAFHLLKSKIDVNKSRRLAFITKSGEHDVLYVQDIPSKKIIEKFEFNNLVGLASPAWSPDETKIIFSGLNSAGNNDLYVIDIPKRELTKLTNDVYDDLDPCWSPDGKSIIFCSDRNQFGEEGYYNLFLYNFETGRIEYVTAGKHSDYSPAWSPSGESIAFTSDRDGVLNIYVLKLPRPSAPTDEPFSGVFSHQVKKVTNLVTAAFDPEWTDTGDLLFTAFENFNFQIRMVSAIDSLMKDKPRITEKTVFKKDRLWEPHRIVGSIEKNITKYEKKYTLDFVQTQVTQHPVYGTAGGGAAFALTDMLGNDQYYFLVYNNAETQSELLKSFNVAFTKISLQKRANYAYGGFRLIGKNYYNSRDQIFQEERVGGFFTVSYPLSHFERIEASIAGSYSDKYLYLFEQRKISYLVSDFVAYVKDNSLWGPTGPIDGERMNLTLGYTTDVKNSFVNYYTIIFDYRKYIRTSNRTAWATRLTSLINEGKYAQQFYFGGSWDLRGYPIWSIRTTKLTFISNEFRYPFIDQFAIRFPFMNIGFNAIRGAFFFDAGHFWEAPSSSVGTFLLDEFDLNKSRTLGSFGAGIRFNVGGFLVLRLDIGRTTDFHSISNSNFAKFFFGWDF